MMSILKGFLPVFGKKAVLEWCMKEGLIASSYVCPKCGKPMELRERTGKSLNDGFEWLCRNRSSVKEENHYVSRSVRKGSWFQLSNMDMCTVLLVMRKWFGRCPQKYAVADLGVGSHTAVNWYNFCREVCIHVLIRDSCKNGGVDAIVEVDESKFGKMKYEWVLPGTTIISDCWASYNCLKDEGFQHLKVNHSLTFVCPVTGAHTNSIEGSWSGIKRFLGNTTHRTEDMFDSYLHEFMWRRKNSHSVENEVFKAFLADVASFFSPLQQDVSPEHEIIPQDDQPGTSSS
ncbi:mitotic-spindle organizing protein 2A [Trichonephila clavipes]|uniref:Mitotic-spindle organizing protein 2A n=1 Tax=Trichonephila clavipes TaxID=2585209 RepID=A0A8X6T6I2_TRICX|nr:mitotic-spindle organizing protein 2A [Trichonephila clavipes]